MKAKESVQKEKEEMQGRYDLQLTALNENLSTLRQDMNTSATRAAELQKATDELRGEKLGKRSIWLLLVRVEKIRRMRPAEVRAARALRRWHRKSGVKASRVTRQGVASLEQNRGKTLFVRWEGKAFSQEAEKNSTQLSCCCRIGSEAGEQQRGAARAAGALSRE